MESGQLKIVGVDVGVVEVVEDVVAVIEDVVELELEVLVDAADVEEVVVLFAVWSLKSVRPLSPPQTSVWLPAQG